MQLSGQYNFGTTEKFTEKEYFASAWREEKEIKVEDKVTVQKSGEKEV